MIILKPFIFVVWKVFVFGELHNGCFYIERAANIGDEKEIVMCALIFVCSGLPESGVDVLDWNNNLNVVTSYAKEIELTLLQFCLTGHGVLEGTWYCPLP